MEPGRSVGGIIAAPNGGKKKKNATKTDKDSLDWKNWEDELKGNISDLWSAQNVTG